MKLAIVGSRCYASLDQYNTFKRMIYGNADAFLQLGGITEIVSGGADGIDSFAEHFADENNIPKKIFYPKWELYGKAAGHLRNKEIVDYCDYLIAFWDGQSKGTKNSIDLASNQKKLLIICKI